MPQPALCRAEDSALLIVDVQERLAGAMSAEDTARVEARCTRLLQAADRLQLPVLLTEQYPKGLGPTREGIRQVLPQHSQAFEKTRFSCCGATDFITRLQTTGRRQVVIAGMETHVCVLQTALELHNLGFECFVVEDAVCSRDPANHANALARLRQAGVVASNSESVLFEWLRDAGHEHFKAFSQLVR